MYFDSKSPNAITTASSIDEAVHLHSLKFYRSITNSTGQ